MPGSGPGPLAQFCANDLMGKDPKARRKGAPPELIRKQWGQSKGTQRMNAVAA